jgi:hypothetical protein
LPRVIAVTALRFDIGGGEVLLALLLNAVSRWSSGLGLS